MTAQSRVDITKETHHGRREKVHLAEDREDQLLRNLRMLILFLRLPAKRLSLRANQLPMWLPQANLRSVGCYAPPTGLWWAGSTKNSIDSTMPDKHCEDLAAHVLCILKRIAIQERQRKAADRVGGRGCKFAD